MSHSRNSRNPLVSRRPVVALDFDGVICNSLDECMQVAFTAYTGNHSVPATFAEYFRAYRHFVRPAYEYWILVDAYHRGTELSQSLFTALVQAHEAELIKFEPVYFQTRESIRSADFQGWLRLHSLYPQFAEGWAELSKSATTHVVSTRDRDSLGRLLESFGIGIPSHRWWTKERTKTKPEAINGIAAEHNIRPSEIVFVDDHPGHLDDVARTGATVFWADWGFWPAQNLFDKIGSIQELCQKSEKLSD